MHAIDITRIKDPKLRDVAEQLESLLPQLLENAVLQDPLLQDPVVTLSSGSFKVRFPATEKAVTRLLERLSKRKGKLARLSKRGWNTRGPSTAAYQYQGFIGRPHMT